jgi:hypothetical protein
MDFFQAEVCAVCDSVGDFMGQGDLCKFSESSWWAGRAQVSLVFVELCNVGYKLYLCCK